MADKTERGLCPRCYASGGVRSAYGADGRRLAGVAIPTDGDGFAGDDDDEAVGASAYVAGRAQRGAGRGGPRRSGPETMGETKARHLREEEALMHAVATIENTSQFVGVWDAKPCAGRGRSIYTAQLSSAFGSAAVARLLAKGRLVEVQSRWKGRLVSALRRTGL